MKYGEIIVQERKTDDNKKVYRVKKFGIRKCLWADEKNLEEVKKAAEML